MTHDDTGEQLEIVGDAGIPELADFFVSNFWEEDVVPSQVNAIDKILLIR